MPYLLKEFLKAGWILIKVVLVLAAFFLVFALVLGLITHVMDDIGSDMHGELSWAKDPETGEDIIDPETGTNLLSYRGNLYYSAGEWIQSDITDEDVQIGWKYGFPFPNVFFYTDGSEKPLYILCGSGAYTYSVYFRQDFDFRKETLIVEGTDIALTYEEAFVQRDEDEDTSYDYKSYNVTFVLETVPRLKLELYRLYKMEDTWFFMSNGERLYASDELIARLEEASLI